MKLNISNIFSYNKTKTHINFRFLGIKFSCPNYERKLLNREYKKEQDKYDLSNIKNAKKIIAFIIPSNKMINGGIMSIFSICKYSREICPDAECLIITEPGEYTYTHNHYFKNEEKIYRWEQFINNLSNVEELILHIPEYMCKERFYKHLTRKDKKILINIPSFQINILNQNIELMPEPKKINKLKELTTNITQTIAHDRYATQEVCNKWGIPTHLLSVHIDLKGYKSYSFEEKEKIIVLSPDDNYMKQQIIEKLKIEMPDFKLIIVQNITFDDYMDLISKAYFTITFGEGMDGYFTMPYYVGSIGFSIYNERFFPSIEWGQLYSVFKNYTDMQKNITIYMKNLINNKNLYTSTIKEVYNMHSFLYSEEKFINNLKRFYSRNYKF